MGDRSGIKDIRKYLSKLLSSDKPFRDIDDNIENQNLAALLRRRILEEKYGVSLSSTGSSILDFVELEGRQSYKPIGAVQIPVTVVGPVEIDGEAIREKKYIPLASIYPQLMKTIESGVDILEGGRIKISLNYCWLRIFSIGRGKSGICSTFEEYISRKRGRARILCLGGGGGRIINTVIIGENPPCTTIRGIIKGDEVKAYIRSIGSDIPILTPYLVLETRMNTSIPRKRFEEQGVPLNSLLETYNTLEDIRSIDYSLHPILLGSITSFYYAIGVKPEYGLRSEVKGFALYTKFRRIIVYGQPRIVTPIEIMYGDVSPINRELIDLVGLTGGEIDPFAICEISSAISLVSYIGILVEIARSLSKQSL